MNKIIKRKIIASILCIILGIVAIIYALINKNSISDELYAYLCGFTGGICTVGIYILITSINAMRDPVKEKIMQNNENDERLIAINDKSMAITFKICIITEAIFSIVCALLGKMEFAKYLGWLIGVEIIIYLIVYYICSKNN